MGDLFAIFVSGLAQGVPLFIIASGLTLIFGVMHVLNFAHGSFFMVGAFITYSVVGGSSLTFGFFLLGVFIAGVVIGLVGVVSEFLVFRRIHAGGAIASLLAAFGLFLVFEGLSREIWGTQPRTLRTPEALRGATELFGARLATYDVALIFFGVILAGSLWLLLTRTPFGREIRAVAEDRTMAQALGVPAKRVGTLVFFIGSALAGVAGALTAPMVSIEPALAADFIIGAFVVIIVGGVGSISGALVAAALLGIAESAIITYSPTLAGFSFYIAVAAILLFRPSGLFGRPATVGLAR